MHSYPIHAHRTGEIACGGCGLVLADHMIDRQEEEYTSVQEKTTSKGHVDDVTLRNTYKALKPILLGVQEARF